MKRFRTIVFLGVLLGLFTFGGSLQGTALATPQTACPVLGGDIDKNVFVDYQGKRIFFCCKACIDQFNKDPKKYMEKLKAEGAKQ